MKMAGWPEMPEFKFKSIWALTVPILSPEVDVYQTIYYPGDEMYYRCSITGNRLIVEFQEEPKPRMDDFSSGSVADFRWLTRSAQAVLNDFGIEDSQIGELQVKEQKFGKLVPIDDISRRGFIMAMSELYGVYSLGRFATWKPNLLMHEIPGDASVVAGLLEHQDQYGRQLAMLKHRDRL
jgi:hypothetical protein